MKNFHEDLHEGGTPASTGFEAMEEALGGGDDDHQDREIWLDGDHGGGGDLLDVNDAAFYGDFPPLPDFPCMSSSSSSSSTRRPPLNSLSSSSSASSSSSSAASWSVLKSDADEDNTCSYQQQQDLTDVPMTTPALSSTASMEIPTPSDQGGGIGVVDCMDVMEDFGYMDLLESNDFFDPASMFQPDESILNDFQKPNLPPPPQNEDLILGGKNGAEVVPEGGGGAASDDLAMVFLEWLKSNKETVSAEDLRKVKIKKATIECAAKRLGGGKEAMKELLKLILEWVQTNHLHKRRLRESSSMNNEELPFQDHPPPQNPNPHPNPATLNCSSVVQPDHQSNNCFTHSPWIPPLPPYDPVVLGYPPVVGYMGDPFVNGAPSGGYPPPPPDYHMLESSQSWPPSQFAMAACPYSSFGDGNLPPAGPGFAGYGNQYPYQYLPGQGGDGRLVRLGSSATKEARKKRMARQRRIFSHHRNHHHQQNQNHSTEQQQQQQHHARLGNDNAAPVSQANPANWVYWPTAPAGPVSTAPVMPVDPPSAVNTAERPAMQGQNSYHQRQVVSDRRQGWKPEKNLRFLLQKVLKQSDVGNLGRIVLPKKEAETHLPELEARDGISIALEDIGTSRVWNMRYRFWPNNKSRMYLLENTGDFVRTNGLQEGDFIVIYSDVKCGKYLIRGVKVRQAGGKSENKRAGKSQRNSHANSPASVNASSSSPQTQTLAN